MHQTVSVIFEDPGVQELLLKLYQKGKIIFTINLAGSVWLYAYNYFGQICRGMSLSLGSIPDF